MKKRIQKLRLHRETLRLLTDGLRSAVGGDATVDEYTCPAGCTDSCGQASCTACTIQDSCAFCTAGGDSCARICQTW